MTLSRKNDLRVYFLKVKKKWINMGWNSGEKTSKSPSNLEQLSYASESFV